MASSAFSEETECRLDDGVTVIEEKHDEDDEEDDEDDEEDDEDDEEDDEDDEEDEEREDGRRIEMR